MAENDSTTTTATRRPTMRDKYPALAFIMRHIDDAPELIYTRCLQDVVRQASETALCLAVAGEVAAATAIVCALREHCPNDVLFSPVAQRTYPFLGPCMFFAWEATSWPEWIPVSDRTEAKLGEMEKEARKHWLQFFTEPWSADVDTAEKARAMADRTINRAFPQDAAKESDRILLTARWFAQGRYGFAADPNGLLDARYMDVAMRWRSGVHPTSFMQLYRSAGLATALDVYLSVPGSEKEAGEVFGEIAERFTFFEQAEMLACSRAAWKGFLARQDGDRPLLDELQIGRDDLRDAADRAVQMVQKRLVQGAVRPFGGKTIQDLARLVSSNTVERCPWDAFRSFGQERRKPENDQSLLRPPYSKVAELEAKLGTDLPQDYKELLAFTNGMEPIWNGGPMLDIFARAEEVEHVDIGHLSGLQACLVRDDDPHPVTGNDIEWPSLPAKAISLSPPGSPAHLLLLDRETTAACKRSFFEQFEQRTAEQKAELERVVCETYGSVEDFRSLERGLVLWRDYELDMMAYNGVRGLLEVLGLESMRRYRFWLRIYEPGRRFVSDGEAWD
ncbi:hypothetical protein MCOR02_005127 [Pyricularia oryzae]|uniref:Knr4/Smi1-like domain-containing protein n=1 Tax=Pyricularia oryzae TaxID=318829 RepID=A0A4P7N0X0_PYROR|nr:hypothetical protein MCOR02_005127 [Pyricularia oryzae]KAI6321437.1 hypothetical protein MCOR34_002639 [Pyricularia oryzae]KAI6474604.1 hypothetical protein MCOR17_002042 [Pyricularia oryzae]KAI6505574.1 hypothetical protein MCOR13_004072 [Pyricularia oryzae]KAI6644168.1 hypothetical protein MCOR14_001398 [Pyricularia oryzae]